MKKSKSASFWLIFDQYTKGFLVLSEDINWEQRPEMG